MSGPWWAAGGLALAPPWLAESLGAGPFATEPTLLSVSGFLTVQAVVWSPVGNISSGAIMDRGLASSGQVNAFSSPYLFVVWSVCLFFFPSQNSTQNPNLRSVNRTLWPPIYFDIWQE